jgi:uncharacterized protein YndB with AHSA1/START domain
MSEKRGSGKLKVTLPSDTEILLTRVFDAPRRLVFEAMTKAEYVRRWWCCMDGYTMTVCEVDLRVGGRWRYVMIGPQCGEVAFNGVYKEIVAPERVVYSEFFEPHPDGIIVTVTLEERDGKTYYSSLSRAVSKDQRDIIIASGMEGGADLALDVMEQVAQSIDPARRASGAPSSATAPG